MHVRRCLYGSLQGSRVAFESQRGQDMISNRNGMGSSRNQDDLWTSSNCMHLSLKNAVQLLVEIFDGDARRRRLDK